MDHCCNLYLMSTLACQLTECMSEAEIAALAADLATLGCMLTTILTHKELCSPNQDDDEPITLV